MADRTIEEALKNSPEVASSTEVFDKARHQGAISANVATSHDVRVTTPEKVCGMGHRMKRKEDPRFLRGTGRYVDDIKLPGML